VDDFVVLPVVFEALLRTIKRTLDAQFQASGALQFGGVAATGGFASAKSGHFSGTRGFW
jgi:hypothetical protein